MAFLPAETTEELKNFVRPTKLKC